MINFNLPSSKWQHESPFQATSAYIDDYSRHFKIALHNFDMNMQEERLKRKKKGKK
jgi:hypothetical protein